MVKKFICAASVVFSLFISVCAFAEGDVKLVVNGTDLSEQAQAQIIDGRTMVPMRLIFEQLGAEVEWDGTSKTVTARKDKTEIVMQIGNTLMLKDKEYITLDVAPCIINDRTLVPARAVSESLNCVVDWDETSKTVNVSQEEESVSESTTELTTFVPTTVQPTVAPTTLETTTEAATEATTEATTVVLSINQRLINQVKSDLSAAVSSYSLGSASNAGRLKKAYLVNNVKPAWDKMAQTKDEKSFVSAANKAYNNFITYATGIDYYYTKKPYSRFDETNQDCRNTKKEIVDIYAKIFKAQSPQEVNDLIKEAEASYKKLKDRMMILKGNQ